MHNAYPYFRGVDTSPDVRKLVTAFGTPEDGARIKYSDVGVVIEADHGGKRHNRFVSVTNAWRRHLLRKHNILIVIEDDTFVATTGSMRVTEAIKRLESARKQVRRAIRDNTLRDEQLESLSAEERKTHDKVDEVGCKLIAYHTKERKNLASVNTFNKALSAANKK